MKSIQDHAVRPIEWIQGLDGWQELANRIKVGAKKRKEQLSEEAGAEEIAGEIDEEGESVEMSEDGEPGIRKARQLQDPRLPSEQDVKDHYTNGHLPYRSWCHHCVRG